MQIKDLKQYAEEIALERQYATQGKYNQDQDLNGAFMWAETPEGDDIWSDVMGENYTTFMAFHNISEEELALTPKEVEERREQGDDMKAYAFVFTSDHVTTHNVNLEGYFAPVKARNVESAKKQFHTDRKQYMDRKCIITPILIEDLPAGLKPVDNSLHRPDTGIASRYVYTDKLFKALDIAYTTGRNLINYGSGGFGKSDITLEFFKERGITPYVMTLGKGTTIDALFGGIDLNAFNNGIINKDATQTAIETAKESGSYSTEQDYTVFDVKPGSIHYLVEHSFMNHEYVVFEEMLDAPDYIVERLKDVLSSKVLRNGSQQFELKTKCIIANTNHTRSEFAKKDRSLLALLERFPLTCEVKWESHLAQNYDELLDVTCKIHNPTLSYILEQLAKEDKIISPRIAITAAQLIEECGVECLDYIAEFEDNKTLVKKAVKKFESRNKMHKKASELSEIEKALSDLGDLNQLKQLADLRKARSLNNNLKDKIKELEKITTDDALVSEKAELISGFNQYHKTNEEIIDKLINQV